MTDWERIYKVSELQDSFQESYLDFKDSSVSFKDLWIDVNEKFSDENVTSLEESYRGVKSNYWRTIEEGKSLLRHEDKDLTRSLGAIFRKCGDKLDDIEDVMDIFQYK